MAQNWFQGIWQGVSRSAGDAGKAVQGVADGAVKNAQGAATAMWGMVPPQAQPFVIAGGVVLGAIGAIAAVKKVTEPEQKPSYIRNDWAQREMQRREQSSGQSLERQ
jgi:hypothetical protein